MLSFWFPTVGTQLFGMSQSGSSNDITVAIAGCSTPLHSTSTSSWTVSSLIPRPSTKQDNIPTVSPLALGVVRVQWQFATSTVHQQQASATTRARSTAVAYPSRISLWPTTGWRCIARERANVFTFPFVWLCHWAGLPDAVPNSIPCHIFLGDGDGILLAVPPESQDRLGVWLLAYWNFNQCTALVLHLH